MKGLRPKCGIVFETFHEWRYKGLFDAYYWYYCIHCLTITYEKEEYRKELEK